MLLKDKTAVITGCSRGIGLSILENFSSNGANIIACVRKNNNQFQDKVKRLEDKHKVNINIISFDLQFEEEVEKGEEQEVEEGGEEEDDAEAAGEEN